MNPEHSSSVGIDGGSCRLTHRGTTSDPGRRNPPLPADDGLRPSSNSAALLDLQTSLARSRRRTVPFEKGGIQTLQRKGGVSLQRNDASLIERRL